MPRPELPSETLIVATADVRMDESIKAPSDFSPLRNAHAVLLRGADSNDNDLELALDGAGYKIANSGGGLAVAVRRNIEVVSGVNFPLESSGLDGANHVMVASKIRTTGESGVTVAIARLDTPVRAYARYKQTQKMGEALGDDYFDENVILGVDKISPHRPGRSYQNLLDHAGMETATVLDHELPSKGTSHALLGKIGLGPGREVMLYRGGIRYVTSRIVEMKRGVRAMETIFALKKPVRA